MQNSVVWDTEENMQLVRERVNLLLRGCKCVTGCKNRVFGCKGKNSKCIEGCQCINCENEISPAVESDELSVIALEEEVQSRGNSYLNEDEEDEFAEFVFAATCATDSETNISMTIRMTNYMFNECIHVLVFLTALLFTVRKLFWHNNYFTKIGDVLANILH